MRTSAARRMHSSSIARRRHAASIDDSLTTYLREIAAYPLIARADEAALAKRIRAGDAAALERLVCSNLRFVVSVAKKYQNQGVSLADLIDEGNLGLIRAAQKFDESKDTKFISYAVWWVRQAIYQALADQSNVVRVPLGQAATLQRIGKHTRALFQELGCEPTQQQIATSMDLSEDEIANTMTISHSYVSLDAPLGAADDARLLDYLPDNLSPAPDEELVDDAQTKSILGALGRLKGREARVLRLYFGLGDDEPMTLEAIGNLFGVTRERVRQIKEQALARLRKSPDAHILASFSR